MSTSALTTYVPTATFTARPAYGGSFSQTIPADSKLGPVPETDAECQTWLRAALEIGLGKIEHCEESADNDSCDCEQCFYAARYPEGLEVDTAERLVAELVKLNPTGFRNLIQAVADVYYRRTCVTWGAGHTLSDAILVATEIIDRVPLSECQIPGCELRMPTDFD